MTDFHPGRNQLVVVSLRLPCAKSAAVGANVVEGGLSRVGLLFPLPLVDDELPLEVGQELEVLLLLGHAHHLQKKINIKNKALQSY